MNAPAPTSARINPRHALLLFLVVLVFAIPQALLLPLLDRDEPRFAEAAREMIETGNFVVPHFNHVPRYDKPPLIYWCQAAAYAFCGENAFAARLPSLLATAATAVLIYTWGVRIGTGRVGLSAGLCFAFCAQTVQQGRVATADGLLIFFMTLSAFAGWLVIRPRESGRAPLACHVALALGFAGGFLAKGPEAWLPLIALLVCGRGRRLAVTNCFLVSIGIALLWGVPAYLETNGDYLWQSWKSGIADRAWGSDQGHGASSVGLYLAMLPYYLVLFWVSALPWSPLILLRSRKLLSDWKLDPADIYLLWNIVPLFVIFTLMATKLPHYTLPAFPMIALLFIRRSEVLHVAPGLPARLAVGFAIILMAIVAVDYQALPSAPRELVRAAASNLTPETPFALVDFKEPSAVWEMRGVTRSYAKLASEQDVVAFMDSPGPHAVILSTGLAYHLRMQAATTAQWKGYEGRGFNAAKGKFIDLTLLVKP